MTPASIKYRRLLSVFAPLFLLFIFLISLPAYAENNVKASLISENSAITTGKDIRLGVLLDAADGWHTYYKEPGDAGLPTKLNWQLPEGFAAAEIDWPEPLKIAEGDLTTYGYVGKTLLPVTITIPKELPEKSYIFTVTAQWLTCNQICIPESQTMNIELPVGEALPSESAGLFPAKEKPSLPSANPAASGINAITLLITLSFALLGGLVLNVMPCVLPVLSLKTLALVKKSGHKRAHTAKYGIAYMLGILFSFATVAFILISLQQGGAAIGWGFQMQSPAFIGFMVFLFAQMGKQHRI